MNKKLSIVSALALGLALAGCSSEEPMVNFGDGNVTFTVQLPGVSSRSFGDGDEVNTLKCIAFDTNGGYVHTFDGKLAGKKGEVSLNLASGTEYQLIFWSDKDNAYTISNTGVLSVDYESKKYVTNGADAFYKVMTYRGGSSEQEAISLSRPFAQLNFGTNDSEMGVVQQAYPNGVYTTVTTEAYKSINLLTGATGERVTITTPVTKIADLAKEKFDFVPETGYKYTNMLYLLVPREGMVSDLEFKAYTSSDAEAANWAIPVHAANLKENYRTNVYGSLLTSTTDFNVTVVNSFAGSENNPYRVAKNVSDLKENGGVFEVTPSNVENVGENVDLSDITSSTPVYLKLSAPVKTLTLGAATPVTVEVAKDVKYPAFSFKNGVCKNVTLKGDPKSSELLDGFRLSGVNVENLVVDGVGFGGMSTKGEGNNIFYMMNGGSIKNLTIRNCVITTSLDQAPITINVYDVNNSNVIDNVLIENNTLIGTGANIFRNGVYIVSSGAHLVRNVTIRNNTINNPEGAHGIIVGSENADVVIEGNNIVSGRDGIKFDGGSGTPKSISITGNTVKAKENVIRVKDPRTASVVVTDNTVDVSIMGAFSESAQEPWGILVINSSGKIVCKNNIKVGTTEYWSSFNNCTGTGNDIETPFK